MSILAIDTATLSSSIALLEDGRILAELNVHTGKTHSERLVPQIVELLRCAGVARKDLRGIAVSIGPGSFTGLRIGLGTAKALAYGLGVPILGVNTLEGLAANVMMTGVVLSPLLDAQKGNVYQGLYEWRSEGLAALAPVEILPLEAAVSRAAAYEKPGVLLGEMNGCVDFALPDKVSVAPAHLAFPRAASIAMLAGKRFDLGEKDDVFALQPYYLRRSEAEVLWEQRHGAEQQ